jgi:hypothetical protein
MVHASSPTCTKLRSQRRFTPAHHDFPPSRFQTLAPSEPSSLTRSQRRGLGARRGCCWLHRPSLTCAGAEPVSNSNGSVSGSPPRVLLMSVSTWPLSSCLAFRSSRRTRPARYDALALDGLSLDWINPSHSTQFRQRLCVSPWENDPSHALDTSNFGPAVPGLHPPPGARESLAVLVLSLLHKIRLVTIDASSSVLCRWSIPFSRDYRMIAPARYPRSQSQNSS